MEKVTRRTRAPVEGKEIICPHCNKPSTVYHFSWSALQCEHCLKIIVKTEWICK